MIKCPYLNNPNRNVITPIQGTETGINIRANTHNKPNKYIDIVVSRSAGSLYPTIAQNNDTYPVNREQRRNNLMVSNKQHDYYLALTEGNINLLRDITYIDLLTIKMDNH
ncbi:unnamed protein product [Nezara viridula]|uniref:Uncharacterized protein n=1 Tax=Nezara viridula TaxID=85310 RepID=A0A9P0HG12_NEZVI|nr:unnamed protein product [Nezara viridula]